MSEYENLVDCKIFLHENFTVKIIPPPRLPFNSAPWRFIESADSTGLPTLGNGSVPFLLSPPERSKNAHRQTNWQSHFMVVCFRLWLAKVRRQVARSPPPGFVRQTVKLEQMLAGQIRLTVSYSLKDFLIVTAHGRHGTSRTEDGVSRNSPRMIRALTSNLIDQKRGLGKSCHLKQLCYPNRLHSEVSLLTSSQVDRYRDVIRCCHLFQHARHGNRDSC